MWVIKGMEEEDASERNGRQEACRGRGSVFHKLALAGWHLPLRVRSWPWLW